MFVYLYSGGWLFCFSSSSSFGILQALIYLFSDCPVAELNVGAYRMCIFTFSYIFQMSNKDKVSEPVAVVVLENRHITSITFYNKV